MAHFLFFCRYPKVRVYQFERGRETERDRDIHTHRDTQTDRQAGMAGRQTDGQTDRQR